VTGLVNGAIVEFYGFADRDGALIRDEIIATPPAYMLVKLKHDVGVEISFPGLPPSLIGIEPVSLTYNAGHGKAVTYFQFPVTLAYAITDYKMSGSNVHMGRCRPQKAEWRLFPYILAIHSTISCQNTRSFIHPSSFCPRRISVSSF